MFCFIEIVVGQFRTFKVAGVLRQSLQNLLLVLVARVEASAFSCTLCYFVTFERRLHGSATLWEAKRPRWNSLTRLVVCGAGPILIKWLALFPTFTTANAILIVSPTKERRKLQAYLRNRRTRVGSFDPFTKQYVLEP